MRLQAVPHALLQDQIGHLLRLRVIQELEMLACRLRAAPRSTADQTILRRLTRVEWSGVKETGKVPWRDAAFVLVVPPVNRNTATGQRIRPHINELPPPQEQTVAKVQNPKELVQLLTVSSPLNDTAASPMNDALPLARVPLYHGGGLFPLASQRAALHSALCQILKVERNARSNAGLNSSKTRQPASRDQQKGSHAFMLMSNASTVLRADPIPLAISLWRLWLWEGGTWDEGV